MMKDQIERGATATEDSSPVMTTGPLRNWVSPTIKNYSVPDATAGGPNPDSDHNLGS
jgi:hypothetical protein